MTILAASVSINLFKTALSSWQDYLHDITDISWREDYNRALVRN